MGSSSDSDTTSPSVPGDDTTTAAAAAVDGTTTPSRTPKISWCDSFSKIQSAIDSLSSILPNVVPPSISSSETPALALLHDSEIAKQFSQHLRLPDSGSGDNNLCRWLYDTFQTSVPDLRLVVLRFLPVLAGVYLSRASLHKPLAGFEAVLLALYAHETTSRDGQAITVSIPDLSHSSIYHESKQHMKSDSTELSMAVISASLEPHGRVRSTRRARIVGVALELYYSKISEIPLGSKIEFCEFCGTWAGDFDPSQMDQNNKKGKGGRIKLSWEILQPTLRILGHCLMGPDPKNVNKELQEAACGACRALHARSLLDINPRAILATGSLLKLANMDTDNVDYTEITFTNIINL